MESKVERREASGQKPATEGRRPAEKAASAPMLDSAMLATVDDAPAGPSPEEEAAFLAEERMATPVMSPTPTAAVEGEDVSGPLPPLDELVARIPAPARELLEELFRSRFVTVKRVPRSALKE